MENFLKESMDYLAREDGEVSTWLLREYQRQQENIELIASENILPGGDGRHGQLPDQQVRRGLSRAAVLRRMRICGRD